MEIMDIDNSHSKQKQEHKFTSYEKRNLTLFLIGIMAFKFTFECLSPSIGLFVLNRMNDNGNATQILANLVVLYGVCQSLGSSISSGLMNRFFPHKVMTMSLCLLIAMASTYNLIEAGTGGTRTTEGEWNPWIVYPLYMAMGLSVGALETCRRIISSSIVGSNIDKLKRMDAMIHIFYEIGGTAGAFLATFLIQQLGPVYSTGPGIILYVVAAVFYSRISIDESVYDLPTKDKTSTNDNNCCLSLWQETKKAFFSWLHSMKEGAQIVFSSRKFIWLIPCYALPLVIHRLYENVMFPFFAKNVLKDGSLSGVMVSASNFGELLGALCVMLLANRIKSPIPWIRVDALMMFVMWTLVYVGDSTHPWVSIGILIPLIIPVSFGWAAGDVSLLAYIQGILSSEDEKEENQSEEKDTKRLTSVMCFLYAVYVLFMTGIANGLGTLLDKYNKQGDPRQGLFYVAGIMMSCIAVVIFVSTFIPPKISSNSDEEKPQSGQ